MEQCAVNHSSIEERIRINHENGMTYFKEKLQIGLVCLEQGKNICVQTKLLESVLHHEGWNATRCDEDIWYVFLQ